MGLQAQKAAPLMPNDAFAESAKSRWDSFVNFSDAVTKMAGGESTPEDTLHTEASVFQMTGEPVVRLRHHGCNAIRNPHNG
jgi:hypothetical protein